MDSITEAINAIEKAKNESEKFGLDKIIIPFKDADLILYLLRNHVDQHKPTEGETVSFRIRGNLYRFFICPYCGGGANKERTHCTKCGRELYWKE